MSNIKKQPQTNNSLFGKQNYMWMLAGLAIMAIGFIIMAGGKSADPKVFDVFNSIGFNSRNFCYYEETKDE
ncbi:MAG: DUF3098 domain-containing protein [Chitinophagaceae bacterium]|nr:DUF3098 domain-containing protein [Chitinophagaceae bacterium]